MSALCLALAACGSPTEGLDAGPRDGSMMGGLPTCAAPLLVEGSDTTPSLIDVDTRMGPEGGLDVSDCNGGGPSPQVVIAYRVPGEGSRSVLISTANVGTDRSFDTVLAIRRGACEDTGAITEQFCFDDEGTDRRASGQIEAMGGETLYIVATGYFDSERTTDRGPMTIQIKARPNAPPTITDASVLVTSDAVRVQVAGGDMDGDGAGVRVTFHGPAGELVDIDRDGLLDEYDALSQPFDRPVTGAATFMETATIPIRDSAIFASSSEAWVRIYDEAGVRSVVDVPVAVVTGTIVGSGEACDATTVCATELVCRLSVCSASAERAAACGAAMPLSIATPSGMATEAAIQSVLMPGVGLFTGACVETQGREDVYSVSVPDVRVDVVATTDSAGTPVDVDTVLYARADCLNPASSMEDWCQDDIDVSTNRRSTIELLDQRSTTVYLFVEHWRSVPADTTARYELSVRLRPVLSAGAACDPTGALNRCASGACPAATRVCP